MEKVHAVPKDSLGHFHKLRRRKKRCDWVDHCPALPSALCPIAGSLPCLQNRGKRIKAPFAQAIGGSSLFGAQEHVKEKGDSQSVTAIFQLGNWCLSRGLSKNDYERFLSSRSFHSPSSLKAASPADFA